MAESYSNQQVEIINIKGLHARAAAKFVKLVSSFEAEAQVKLGEIIVSGTSIMGLLMLAASKGTIIEISTSGPEALPLMEALVGLIKNKFYEEN